MCDILLFRTGTNYEKIFYKDYEELFERKNKLAEELRAAHYKYQLPEQKYEDARKEIDRLNGLLNTDGTNSGIPTSKTPINKPKIIPNSRKRTGKKRGGQKGHPKKRLERFADDEVNKRVKHELNECPECHGSLEKIGTIEKDVLDYKIVVEKTRHTFDVYHCPCCGKEVHAEIPNTLKEENQYGPQVQSLALTPVNVGHIAMNGVRKIISGLTKRAINLSEGFPAKLQKRAAEGASAFCEELRKEILKQDIVYRDDTVIMINKSRACLRYYGTEALALYKARLHKDKAGLDEDNILKLLSPNTTAVHDHNKVNYNGEYSFANAECNEHLMRDLQKVVDNPGSGWAAQLKQLLSETNKERERKKEAGAKEFAPDYISGFIKKFDNIMADAGLQNQKSLSRYYEKDERTLILRILDYKNEYLARVVDFDVPFTNNLSQRSLRDIKSEMKISGQFQNEKTASYYANIKGGRSSLISYRVRMGAKLCAAQFRTYLILKLAAETL